MSTATPPLARWQRARAWPLQHPRVFLPLAAALWWSLYQTLVPASEWLVARLPVDRASHLGVSCFVEQVVVKTALTNVIQAKELASSCKLLVVHVLHRLSPYINQNDFEFRAVFHAAHVLNNFACCSEFHF
jgi:hypothetical protein